MKKTLMVIMSLVMALAMVFGLVSTAGAAKPGVRVESVSLIRHEDPASAFTIPAGSTDFLWASIFPGDATNQKVTWTSSNKRVAKVVAVANPDTGWKLGAQVIGVGSGNATITVTTADGRRKASCNVTVASQSVASLPYTEDFTSKPDPYAPAGWIETYSPQIDADLIGVIDGDAAGGTTPELFMTYWSYSATNVTYRASTMPINTSSASSTLSLSFKHINYFYSAEKPYTIAVDVSTDGGKTWTPVWEVNPTSTIGPTTQNIDLGAYRGQTINISWRMSGYTWYSDGWHIDDILLSGS